MTFLTTVTLALLATIAPNMQLSKEQSKAVLQEAQSAYDQGIRLQTADPVASKESFRRAAERFQILVDTGIENGKLWYNLGNAQLQSGEIGEAIASYRAGKRYIPSDGRVTANLRYARSLVTNPIQGEDAKSILSRLAFWHDDLPTQVRLAFCVVFWFVCWGLISTRLFRQIPGYKSATILLGCASVALGASVWVDIVDQHQDHGVVTTNEVFVRKGNGVNYAPMLKDPIHEGIEFEVIEQRPDWLHIKLPNGTTGWIQQDDAQIVTGKSNRFRG